MTSRRAKTIIAAAARRRGISSETLYKEFEVWLGRLDTLAQKHELSATAVFDADLLVRELIEHACEDERADVMRRIGRVADKHGIPIDDLMALCHDIAALLRTDQKEAAQRLR